MRVFKNIFILIICYGILISIVTYPLPCLLISGNNSAVIGDFHNSDLPGTLWFIWWLGYSLENKLDFFHTDYLSYPHGENLWCTAGNFLIISLSYPINKIFGLINGYNLTAFLFLILNCIAGFLLIGAIVKRRYLAFLGGFIIGVNQFTLRELAWGRLEPLAIFWFLFFLWSLVKLKNTKNSRFIFSSALFFILTALGSWHYGMISALLVFIWFIAAIFRKEYQFLRSAFFALSIGLLALFLILPLFISELNLEYSFPMTNVDLFHKYSPFFRMMLNNSLSPKASFLPARPLEGGRVPIKISPFIFILSSIFLIRNYKSRGINGYWAILWILSIILSLGPLLRFSIKAGGDTVIHLPFYFLAKYVPFFLRFFWPYRFLSVFFISSAVIIMASIGYWFKAKGIFKRSVFLIGFISIMISELSLHSHHIFPFQATTIEVPGIYSKLKDLPDGIVLELPYCKNAEGLEYLYYQTIHKKKMFNSSFALWTSKIIPGEHRKLIANFDLSRRGVFIKDEKDIDYLKKLGVRYIVFNGERVLENLRGDLNELRRMESRLLNLLGRPRMSSSGGRVHLFILY